MSKKFKKFIRNLIRTFICVVLALTIYTMCAMSIPYINHKEPSDEVVDDFKNKDFYGKGCAEKIKHIKDNGEALKARLKLIQNAESEIDFVVFEMFDDNAGRDLASALANAANRGVKVKLLVDAYKANDLKKSPYFRYLASLTDAEVKFFNPFNVLYAWKAQSRMHDKLIIIDNSTYLVGGRNANDRFLGDYGTKYRSTDRDIIVFSDKNNPEASVHQINDYFNNYFNQDACVLYRKNYLKYADEVNSRYENLKKIYPEAYDGKPLSENAITVGKISLISGPVKPSNKEPDIWYQLNALMKTGKDIIIQTPYVMCSREMYSDLEALKENREISIIINSPFMGANAFGNADYLNQKKKIHSLGLNICEHFDKVSHHTKTIVIDDRLSIVGSFNFDNRSAYINSEIMLVIDSPELNAELRADFAEMTDNSKIIPANGQAFAGEHYPFALDSQPSSFKMYVIRCLAPLFRHLL